MALNKDTLVWNTTLCETFFSLIMQDDHRPTRLNLCNELEASTGPSWFRSMQYLQVCHTFIRACNTWLPKSSKYSEILHSSKCAEVTSISLNFFCRPAFEVPLFTLQTREFCWCSHQTREQISGLLKMSNYSWIPGFLSTLAKVELRSSFWISFIAECM